MNDMTILIIGIVVFGLMFTAIVMTVVEFQELSDEEESRAEARSDSAEP